MPVRSLGSSVLKWPDRSAVDQAVRVWAKRQPVAHPNLERLGYFGSYARGDWGVGSDLDLVAIVTESPEPFISRSVDWNLTGLPVPAELLVYTSDEWADRLARADRFANLMATEVVWIYPQDRSI